MKYKIDCTSEKSEEFKINNLIEKFKDLENDFECKHFMNLYISY